MQSKANNDKELELPSPATKAKDTKKLKQMKTFFKELFEYNHHCNQKLNTIFIDNQDESSEKSINLFNHLLNAHQIWNNRIDLHQQPFGVWQIHSPRDYVRIDKDNFDQSMMILVKFNLQDTINYTNSKGRAFTNSIQDVLFHIINHSTYHRGQIATAFRASGVEPLVTDYIFHKR